MQTIKFTLKHPRWGEFKDSITVSDGTTPDMIEALQQERFAAWVDRIENPPPPPPPDLEASDG